MPTSSAQIVYNNLEFLNHVDPSRGAAYRQEAQEVLADPEVSLSWRQAIADRLNHANQVLGLLTVGKNDDSY
jgi:ABC-type glutathione transport system ATPase component